MWWNSLWVLMALAHCWAAPPPTGTDYEAIIVGGGAAGVAASARLGAAGRRVLLLEAHHYIGGRVRTEHFGDGIQELGAEWIHGTEDSRVAEAAASANIAIKTQDSTQLLFSNGSLGQEWMIDLLKTGLSFEFDRPNVSRPLGEYITEQFKVYLKEHAPQVLEDKGLLQQMLVVLDLIINSIEGSSSWNDLNSFPTAVDLGGNQASTWHTYGYSTFFDILLNKYNGGPGYPTVEIKLNTPVEKIEWGGARADVRCKGGASYTAPAVIFTGSLGVLKEHHKSLFSPPLPPPQQEAIESLAMGRAAKVALSFERPWWPRAEDKYYYNLMWKPEDLQEVPEAERWTTRVAAIYTSMGNSNVLVLWLNGDVAETVEKLPEDQVKQASMKLVRRFLRGGNATEPTALLRSSWVTDPYVLGVYSYDPPFTGTRGAALRGALGEVARSAKGAALLLAGEVTHPTRYSTVHGAADTGIRQAERVLEILKEIK